MTEAAIVRLGARAGEFKRRKPRCKFLKPTVYHSVVPHNPLADKAKTPPSYDLDLMVPPVGSIRGRELQSDRVLWSVDIETTGLQHYGARIVQLAAVPYFPDGTRGAAHVWFFDPEVPVEPEAEAIHGLSNQKLAGQPKFEERATEILDLFAGGDFLGYNIKAFDIRLMGYAFARAGYAFPAPGARVIDAFRIFRSNVTRDAAGGNHKLNTAHKFYCGTDIRDAHDAEADAQATLDVMLREVAVHREVPATTQGLHAYTQEKRPFAKLDTYRRHAPPELPKLRPYTLAPRRLPSDPSRRVPPAMPPGVACACLCPA